jgi:hypothetical protein
MAQVVELYSEFNLQYAKQEKNILSHKYHGNPYPELFHLPN